MAAIDASDGGTACGYLDDQMLQESRLTRKTCVRAIDHFERGTITAGITGVEIKYARRHLEHVLFFARSDGLRHGRFLPPERLARAVNGVELAVPVRVGERGSAGVLISRASRPDLLIASETTRRGAIVELRAPPRGTHRIRVVYRPKPPAWLVRITSVHTRGDVSKVRFFIYGEPVQQAVLRREHGRWLIHSTEER